MIPLGASVEAWLRHIFGQEKLPETNRKLLEEAVELDEDGPKIISTYGKEEFWAAIAFVDMRGFSEEVTELSPKEIRDFVRPFIEHVIHVAKRHQAVVDKTIGDEVMLVFPEFGMDAQSSSLALKHDPPDLRLLEFCSDMAKDATQFPMKIGASIGKIVLDEVGTEGYKEWTCYGNVVNVAKRLQQDPGRGRGSPDLSFLCYGLTEKEHHQARETVEAFHIALSELSALRQFEGPGRVELKGVGTVHYSVSSWSSSG